MEIEMGTAFEDLRVLQGAEEVADEQAQAYATQLTNLARQLNVFVASLKTQRKIASKQTNPLREIPVPYEIDTFINTSIPLFDEDELKWLQTIPKNDSRKA